MNAKTKGVILPPLLKGITLSPELQDAFGALNNARRELAHPFRPTDKETRQSADAFLSTACHKFAKAAERAARMEEIVLSVIEAPQDFSKKKHEEFVRRASALLKKI